MQPKDPKSSPEYKQLLADLACERRVKADLMANLKAMTTANDAARATLLQELEEARTSRDALATEFEELQDEFDSVRGIFESHDKEGEGLNIELTQARLAALDLASVDESTIQDSKLTALSLRALVYHIEQSHSRRTRNALKSFAERLPQSKADSTTFVKDDSEVESILRDRLTSVAKLTVTPQIKNKMLALLDHRTEIDSVSLTTDKACEALIAYAEKSADKLQAHETFFHNILYKAIPSTFQDLFSLLNRSSSFTSPAASTAYDEFAESVYTGYLTSQGTTLSHTIRKYITSHQKSRQKISYRNFNAGDLALFLPTSNANSPAWAAFNVGAPHYFLDMKGVDTDGKDFLIGRIQEIKENQGEPGVGSPIVSVDIGSAAGSPDTRKWWEVKISEKKKALPIATGE